MATEDTRKTTLKEAIDNTVSTADFEDAVKTLMEFVQGIDQRTLQEVAMVKKTFAEAVSKLQADHGASLEDIKKQVDQVFVGSRIGLMEQEHHGRMATVDNLYGEHQARMAAVDRMISDARATVSSLEPDKGEKGDPGSPDTPEEVRDKLESLRGDDRLDISAIKGIDELERRVTRTQSTGTIAIQRGAVKAYDLSDQLDGVLKTFALPTFWRVIGVHLSSFPNILRPTVDYTTDGALMTITFTSEINAASSLAAGQTLIIVYAEP